MDTALRNIITLVVAFLLMVGGIFYFLWSSQNTPGKLDLFAKCLKEKEAVLYGAFWSLYSQDQKKLFGNSKKYLTYVECSSYDNNSQLQVCAEQEIEIYPTWKFADGSKEEGELTLQQLSDKLGCALP